MPTVRLRNSYDLTFRNYKKQFRTNVKKLVRDIEGDGRFEFAEVNSVEGIRKFYKVLLLEMKNKHCNIPPLCFT